MSVFSEIMALRKSDAAKAYELAKSSYTDNPTDSWIKEAYGWTIYDQIKIRIEQKPSYQNVATYIEDYLVLELKLPSFVHSNFLRLIGKLADDPQCPLHEIMSKNIAHNFRPEDWNKTEWQDKKYPGIAEKVTQVWAKKLLATGNPESIQTFLPVIEDALNKITDNVWLYYYYAKLLLKINRPNEALNNIIPVVKQKSADYWTWALLANIYVSLGDSATAASCYCKALLCKVDDNFLINTRLDFGKLMHSIHKDDVAKTEIARSIRARQEFGYSVTEELTTIQNQPWYKDAKDLTDNTSFYLNNKRIAEEILYSSIPWVNANIGNLFRDTTRNQDMVEILYSLQQPVFIEKICLKQRSLMHLGEIKSGEAIRFKGESVNGRLKILLIEKRDALNWDCIPLRHGVVNRIDQDIIYCSFDNTKGKIHQKAHELQIGDGVEIRTYSHTNKEGKTINKIVQIAKTDQLPPNYKPFNGELKIPEGKGFGFVGDIFISPRLIGDSYKNGDLVTGVAAYTQNSKKMTYGWAALNINHKL